MTKKSPKFSKRRYQFRKRSTAWEDTYPKPEDQETLKAAEEFICSKKEKKEDKDSKPND